MIQKFIRNNACLVYGTLAWNYDRRVTRRTKIKIDRRRRSRLSLFVVEAVGEVKTAESPADRAKRCRTVGVIAVYRRPCTHRQMPP